MSQNNKNRERVEVFREDVRRNDLRASVCENDAAKDTQMDLGPTLHQTLEEYRVECAGFIDDKRFDAMAVDGSNIVMHDRSCFERDAALGAWKQRCAVYADDVSVSS